MRTNTRARRRRRLAAHEARPTGSMRARSRRWTDWMARRTGHAARLRAPRGPEHTGARHREREMHILAIDQGTTSSRAIVFDAQLRVRTHGQESSPAFPAVGLGGTRPRRYVWLSTALASCPAPPSNVPGWVRGISPVSASPIQRETVVVWGEIHRFAHPQGDRLAGSADGRSLQPAARRGARADAHRADRAAGRSLISAPPKLQLWCSDNVDRRPRVKGR